jgi:hypothetical protein
MDNCDAFTPFLHPIKQLSCENRRAPLGENPNDRSPAARGNLSARLPQKLAYN